MLLVMSPAPTSSAQDRATSAITRILLNRPMAKLEDPRDSSLRMPFTSARATWRAGAAPAASAVSTVRPTTNPKIGRSRAKVIQYGLPVTELSVTESKRSTPT